MSYISIPVVAILGLIVSVLLTSAIIPILIHKQAGQNIRQEGPKAHMAKAGTPSMGGIAIVIATLIAGAIGGRYNNDTFIIAIGFVLFALIGFVDDYLKVIKKQNEGLKAWQKFGLQLILSVGFACYMAFLSGHGTEVFIPFAKSYVDFGIWYIPFITFTMLAMVNAVNLTDGLDGLASGITAIVSIYMAYVAVEASSTAALALYSALAGACLGFLVFNKNPAKVFMGDTGSLALGAAITLAAIVMKMELLLPIVGLIYVLEALSVCLQVGYFKLTGGKRLFKMAPLHHHFEESGLKETKVVLLFWSITVICCIIGLIAV